MKEVSKQDKINFYLQFTDNNFQQKLQSIENKYSKIGTISIKVFFVLILVGCFFTPWIVFAALPGFIFPIITMSISNKKIKNEINNLNNLFTYDDLIEMKTSGEWTKLAHEVLAGNTLSADKPSSPKNIDQKNVNNDCIEAQTEVTHEFEL